MEGVFESLPNSFLRFAGLFDFGEHCRFARRMAKREIRAAFTRLVFWPNNTCIIGIPGEFSENAKNNALRNGLLVWEFSLPKSGGNVLNRRFE